MNAREEAQGANPERLKVAALQLRDALGKADVWRQGSGK